MQQNAFGAATGDARLSVVVAAFAEKLRGSYWARGLSWAQLNALHDALPADVKARPQVVELAALMRKAAKLDRRGDRFAQRAAPQ